MAIITLSTLQGYWKNLSDWITGISSNSPKVKMISYSNYYADTLTITNNLSDTPVILGFTAQQIIFLANDGTQDVYIAWDNTTDTSKKAILLRSGESLNNDQTSFGQMNVRLVNPGTSILRFKFIG
jgi:hypothetical protein